MFSLVSTQWTDESSSLHERTIKSLLQVKVNLDHAAPDLDGGRPGAQTLWEAPCTDL